MIFWVLFPLVKPIFPSRNILQCMKLNLVVEERWMKHFLEESPMVPCGIVYQVLMIKNEYYLLYGKKDCDEMLLRYNIDLTKIWFMDLINLMINVNNLDLFSMLYDPYLKDSFPLFNNFNEFQIFLTFVFSLLFIHWMNENPISCLQICYSVGIWYGWIFI